MNEENIFLDEKVLQKLIDKGYNGVLLYNPLRLSVKEATEWIEVVRNLYITLCYKNEGEKEYYHTEIKHLSLTNKQIGATLIVDKKRTNEKDAYNDAIEFCLDDLWEVKRHYLD